MFCTSSMKTPGAMKPLILTQTDQLLAMHLAGRTVTALARHIMTPIGITWVIRSLRVRIHLLSFRLPMMMEPVQKRAVNMKMGHYFGLGLSNLIAVGIWLREKRHFPMALPGATARIGLFLARKQIHLL